MWKIKGESSREIEGGVGKTDDKGRSGGGNEGGIFKQQLFALIVYPLAAPERCHVDILAWCVTGHGGG